MILDLSVQGKLSIEDAILIDKMAPKVQKEYNKFIGQVIRENKLDGLHLLISVCSRDPSRSLILPFLCKVLLLKEKLKQGKKITSIIVENRLMLKVVYSILDQLDQKIPVRINQRKFYIWIILLSWISFLKSLYWIFLSWLWPRLTKVYKKRPKESIVFVDNFILLDSFTDEGEFVDRYYTGYDSYLTNEQNQKIWYSPTLFGFRSLSQYLKMSIQSKKSRHNFLFQESWLTLHDYMHALYLTSILPLKVKKSSLFMGLDIQQLLISEARKDIFSPSLVMSICKFKFIKNLQKEKVEICQVVNWHENQNIDKALNLSFHQYYPSVIVKGYQGYVSPPYEAHKIPQSFELENSTLPSQLHVISENYKKTILDSCPDLNVRVSSAFRFSYLHDVNRKGVDLNIPTILIALPMDITESINILAACSQLHILVNTKINILVKHHPTYSSHIFTKKVPEFLDNAFTPTNRSMSSLLETISLLVSSASSTCAEAMFLGIPVAVHGNRYGVTMNPIAEVKDSAKNIVFYSQKQLAGFVNIALENDNKKSAEQYFFMDNSLSAHKLFVCK